MLSRWAAGELQVWDEVARLESIEGDLRLEVVALAEAIMRRVAQNADQLTQGLRGLGWDFEYEPRPAPDKDVIDQIARLEQACGGRVPLSVSAFWRVVGGIVWTPAGNRLPDGWPDDVGEESLDPLVVEPIACVHSSLWEWQGRVQKLGPVLAGPLDLELAPDRFHKFDISGGSAYGIRLPSGQADALFRNAPEGLRLVAYLRLALQWGGFVGLASIKDLGPSTRERVSQLTTDLEPF